MQNLHTFFPNLKILYLGSRAYAGYSNGVATINPEPYAYEDGFASQFAIADQINGLASINYDPSLGTVKAPWTSWGPYNWGDGMVARPDGSAWTCQDFAGDGTHPSTSGKTKVATSWLNFFKTDTTASPWFVTH